MIILKHIVMDARLNNLTIPDTDNDDHIQRALIDVALHQDKTAFEILFKYFSPKIRAFGHISICALMAIESE